MYQGMKVKATKNLRSFLGQIPTGTLGTITKAYPLGNGYWNIMVKFDGFPRPISTKKGETEPTY